jgi:hypothetical protein
MAGRATHWCLLTGCLAPILISFSLNVVSDHCSMASDIQREIAFALADEVAD